MKKKLLFNVAAGLISASMLLQGAAIPVFAESASAQRCTDII